ncbi:hypothetical protein BJ944DRAFT_286074 [Cunninghamella echinulata]|nr:hypothetical protein BJ944DRAFT_286074 [Cunninghamella echinulata]
MDIENREIGDQLEELFSQTFTLFRSTPLVNFLQKKKKDIIRSLQKKLVDILDLKADRNIMGPPLINTLMDIQFQNMQIDDWEAVDPTQVALEVTIKLWMKGQELPNIHRFIFLPATVKRKDPLDPATRDYPLILVNSKNIDVVNIVKEWLQLYFGCHITSLYVLGSTMSDLINWWAASLVRMKAFEKYSALSEKNCLELTFEILTIQEISTMTVQIPMNQLIKMHRLIYGSKISILDFIYDYIYETTKIKVRNFSISRVGTPIAYISNKGQLKLLPNGFPRHQHIALLSELNDLAGTLF